MEREQALVEALQQPKLDSEQIEALAKADASEARRVTRAAVALWKTREPAASREALSFLGASGELAILPLIEGEMHQDPVEVSAALEVITNAELGLRREMAKRLDQLLDDKRPVPIRHIDAEEQHKPRRVCDVAYLSMCKLVHLGEDPWRQGVDELGFFALPEAKRDEVIAKGREKNVWKRTLDPRLELDEEAPPPSSGRPGSGPRGDVGM